MMNVDQLRRLIIAPALADLVLLSDDAVELLVFTCANESNGGEYIHQINGPALGIYQMEPATYNDIWQNYIIGNNSLSLQLLHNFDAPRMPDEGRMIYDLRFATAMARIHYCRVVEELPKRYDVDGMWKYYKKYYNTGLGKADYQEAIAKYDEFTK